MRSLFKEKNERDHAWSEEKRPQNRTGWRWERVEVVEAVETKGKERVVSGWCFLRKKSSELELETRESEKSLTPWLGQKWTRMD